MNVFVLAINDLGGVSQHEEYLPNVQVFHSYPKALAAMREWYEDENLESDFHRFVSVQAGGARTELIDAEAMMYASITRHVL